MKTIFVISFYFLFFTQLLFPNDKVKNALIMQMQDLNTNEKKLLDFVGIIIIHPNKFPIIIKDYNGVILSDIIISEKLVPNYMDRFYIAHYLRNQMHLGIQEYDPFQKEYRPIADPYYFHNYDLYISKNSEVICNVIYHFISNKFYGVYKNFPSESYSLINDNRLNTHIDLLINKFKNEGLSFSEIKY